LGKSEFELLKQIKHYSSVSVESQHKKKFLRKIGNTILKDKTHTHTLGLSIGVMVFILSKLYIVSLLTLTLA